MSARGQEGFQNPTDWARFLMERYLALEESPHLDADQIVKSMEKTGLYQGQFLHALKKSLDYADQTDQ